MGVMAWQLPLHCDAENLAHFAALGTEMYESRNVRVVAARQCRLWCRERILQRSPISSAGQRQEGSDGGLQVQAWIVGGAQSLPVRDPAVGHLPWCRSMLPHGSLPVPARGGKRKSSRGEGVQQKIGRMWAK
eukprot:CAMPEP_0174311694 /NCGR_PEP_ID=MMETSP0810-20121108/3851_1 /TAXON_ID=73025 ORGANISM="Eutreptiella gymnastica-like, Strain CCMP1594" /NCGR_SAMPLE_ID=MMETSP0810 /ASSEMBLY_ACC=CAM_ASM_000659 /LENGTH=131 /DNA_ID=CAMNT_0015419953 /DNA_START=207 /DNA_END=602 /DNA_ORIENTATION=+